MVFLTLDRCALWTEYDRVYIHGGPFFKFDYWTRCFFLKKYTWGIYLKRTCWRGRQWHAHPLSSRATHSLKSGHQAWSEAAADTVRYSSDHTWRRHAVHGMTRRCEEDLHTRRRDCFLYWAGAGRLRSGDKKQKHAQHTHGSCRRAVA